MKDSKINSGKKTIGWSAVALLAGVLSLFFWRSFLPGYVHFSNDGPLAQLVAAWSKLPRTFFGTWFDANDIGASGGTWALSLSALFRWAVGPVGYAKFLVPFALFVMGVGAWTFFRQLKLSPLAATLGALAAALNSTFFSSACWGVASQQIAIGLDFFALALVVSNTSATPIFIRWARLALAGLAVGMNVMEANDIGAIFSACAAAYIFFKAISDEAGSVAARGARGIWRVAMVAVFAGFIALQTVLSLFGTFVTGVVGTSQDTETKAHQWNFATQWSLPKIETFGLFVPGLFGYKMDTPNGMPDFLHEAYTGGAYWGGMGRDPLLDPYFENGRQGQPASPMFRFSSCGGNYAGVLVTLLAIWAIAQSLRRKDSVFGDSQRREIWFWTVVLIGSLLLAYGRFAPFYKIIYSLPYASTVRNPTKFIIVYSWAIVILFAFAVHGLSRRYLENSAAASSSLSGWWSRVRGFDRKWTIGSVVAVIVSVLGWMIYASEKPALIHYLQTVGYGDEELARQMAGFSIGQVGWFVVTLALAAGLCVLVIAGIFSGKRARLGGILLGVLLVADLGRSNLPYVIHWNYVDKYEVGSLNPIVKFLSKKPYEHRVSMLPFPAPPEMQTFSGIYGIEWNQQLFPYYNVQSLEVVQRPRVGSDIATYESALQFRGTPDTFYLLTRRWQLANVRYLVGPTAIQLQMGAMDMLQFLNDAFDPAQRRFRLIQRFEIVPKPGVVTPTQYSEMTAVDNDNGRYGLYEFAGALPRVKLFSNWQVNTNDDATLATLCSTNFDVWKTALVSTPLPASAVPNANAADGTVDFTSYNVNDLKFSANAPAQSVLLLNDKYDPDWHVTVDGQPAQLLRCNYIMRGVLIPPGQHNVEFRLEVPHKMIYVTLSGWALAILLCGVIFAGTRRREPHQP